MPKNKYITGSQFADMMRGGRGGKEWGKTSLGLAKEIAAQRIGWMEYEDDNYTNEYIEWGNEQEQSAINEYQRKQFTDVHSQQEFQQHPDYEFVGCHPDGLVGESGAIEVKCPKTSNHIDNLLSGAQIPKYTYQMEGTLWVTGREWIDFVSYDPRLKVSLFVKRLERDEDVISEMEERYHKFEQKVQSFIKKLEDYENTN